MDIANHERKYYSDEHLVFSCQYHVVFCPRYRRKVLCGGLDERFKEIIRQDQEKYEYQVLAMEVTPDTVHLLLDVTPRFSIYSTVCHIKALTSRMLRKEFPALKTRIPSLWTRESLIATAGDVSLDVIHGYIESRRRKQ